MSERRRIFEEGSSLGTRPIKIIQDRRLHKITCLVYVPSRPGTYSIYGKAGGRLRVWERGSYSKLVRDTVSYRTCELVRLGSAIATLQPFSLLWTVVSTRIMLDLWSAGREYAVQDLVIFALIAVVGLIVILVVFWFLGGESKVYTIVARLFCIVYVLMGL